MGSNPTGAWIFVCCECRVLSGRGLCDELITRPEESYRLCCVVVCDLETSRMRAPYIYDISRLRVNDNRGAFPGYSLMDDGQMYLSVVRKGRVHSIAHGVTLRKT